jgi:hypothetical protein
MQINKILRVANVEASQLRRMKYDLAHQMNLPAELMLGNLSRVNRRCGRKNCRCVKGPGHPQWQLVCGSGEQRACLTVKKEHALLIASMLKKRQQLLDAIDIIGEINFRLFEMGRNAKQARSTNMTFFSKRKRK